MKRFRFICPETFVRRHLNISPLGQISFIGSFDHFQKLIASFHRAKNLIAGQGYNFSSLPTSISNFQKFSFANRMSSFVRLDICLKIEVEVHSFAIPFIFHFTRCVLLFEAMLTFRRPALQFFRHTRPCILFHHPTYSPRRAALFFESMPFFLSRIDIRPAYQKSHQQKFLSKQKVYLVLFRQTCIINYCPDMGRGFFVAR